MRARRLLSVLMMLALPAAAAEAEEPPAAAPALALETCRLPGLEEEVRCGVYEVFEDRAAREGRKIPLRVAVVPALGDDPDPDPIFYFAGGPGGSAVDSAAGLAMALASLRPERDLVLVDVRGTGESSPLFCPHQKEGRGIEEALETFMPIDRLEACRTALSQSADLTRYTTPVLIDDVDEVRAALGYERINLMGGSYGSRAVLVYLRRHPEAVRSATIQGVAPPDARMPSTFARDAQAALDALFAECAADPDCRRTFPDPAADLAAVLERLEREPVEVEVVDPESGETRSLRISRNVFVQTLRYMLYQALQSLQVPAYLQAAAAGDFDPVGQNAYSFAGALMNSIPDGLYLSVTCAEDVPFIDLEEAERAHAGTFLGGFRLRQQIAACERWVRAEVAPDFFRPVRFAGPVLIVSGERDPVTPAAWGEKVARHLPNSRHLVLPDGAHGSFGLEGVECVDGLVADFVRGASLDGLDLEACTGSIARPAFLLEIPADEAIAMAEDELRRFAGGYQAEGGFVVRIELVDGRLRAQVREENLALVPVASLRFKVEGAAPGTYLEFSAAGEKVSGMELIQGGTAVLKLTRLE